MLESESLCVCYRMSEDEEEMLEEDIYEKKTMREIAELWWSRHSCRQQPFSDFDNTFHGTAWRPRTPTVPFALAFIVSFYLLPPLLVSIGASPFFIFLILVNLGFLYVSFVTCARPSPLFSRFGCYNDLILTNIFAIPLYWTAGSVLMQEISLGSTHYLTYCTAFIMGIHFTYLRWVLPEFLLHSLTLDLFINGDYFTKLALIMIASFPVSLIAFHFYWIIAHGLIMTYMMVYIPIVLGIIWITKTSHPDFYLHVHHYQIGLFAAPLTVFPNHFSVACAGLGCSVFIEGAARWSYAPLWYPKKTKH